MADFCNVDGINMCCWTHGVDISMGEYLEGTCHVAEAERYGCDDDDDDDYYYDYDPEPHHDEALRQVLADALDKAQAETSHKQASDQ